MAVEKNIGLRLVIQLSPDEAAEFRRLAKTDDIAYYEGIAKSLVLGMGEVVVPQRVYEDIELLSEMAEYGRRGDLPAEQEWADDLSFTREQLENQIVKDAICAWAIYFGGDIQQLAEGRWTDRANQLQWSVFNARASSLLEALRNTIKRHAK
jgi:hypothetical protein